MLKFSLFDSLLDSVMVLDQQGQIIYVNDSLTNLLSLRSRQLLKKNFSEISSLKDLLSESWTVMLKEEESTPYLERPLKAAEGIMKTVQFSAQKVDTHFLVYIRDTSLEATLHQKYKSELGKKEHLIAELDRRVFELEFLRSTAEFKAGEGFSLEKGFEKVLSLLKVKRAIALKIDPEVADEKSSRVLFDSGAMQTHPLELDELIKSLSSQFSSEKHFHVHEGREASYFVSWFIAGGSQINVFIYMYLPLAGPDIQSDQNLLLAFSRQSSLLLENDLLFRQSITDEKTGLYNPRYLAYRLEQEVQRSGRYQRPFSLIVFDIDHFKKVNDTYGHLSGDRVLIDVAQIIKDSFRSTDMTARSGGEEFVVLCTETAPENVPQLAERVRARVEAHVFQLESGTTIRVTISAGVAHFPQDGKGKSDLFETADQCLYEAKRSGRNRVISAAALKSTKV